ncbi:MAG: DUF2905 family protein [Anaerolineales bacterium]|nr:DUF2905 family protein [Anaerolineales bacterium]
MDYMNIARVLAVFGLGLLVTAGVFYLLAQLNLPFGKLPGDFVIERGNFTCVIPLISSLIVSILLTILINLMLKK